MISLFFLLFGIAFSELPEYYCVSEDFPRSRILLFNDPYHNRITTQYSVSRDYLFIVIATQEIEGELWGRVQNNIYVRMDDIDPCNIFTPEYLRPMFEHLYISPTRKPFELKSEIPYCAGIYTTGGHYHTFRGKSMANHFNRALEVTGMDSIITAMYFITQIAIESNYLWDWEEAIEDKYRGRGPLKLSGIQEYEDAGRYLTRMPAYYVIDPYLVSEFAHGFKTSAWLWLEKHGLGNRDRFISDDDLRKDGLSTRIFADFDVLSRSFGGGEDVMKAKKYRFLECFKNKFFYGIAESVGLCVNALGCQYTSEFNISGNGGF